MRRDKTIIFLIFVIAFLYLLPSYNKYWAPYDEGNYLITPSMIIEGMVPYRDFFLVMYPPGYAYILAALLKIFGMNLLVGRVYNIFLLSIICASVFYIVKKVTREKYALISFIVCLSTLSSLGEPPIPRPIWPGVTLSLLSVLFVINFIENGKLHNLVLSSFFAGLTIIVRHDIGVLTALAGAIGLLVYGGSIKRAFKLWAMYAIFPVLFCGLLIVWLYKMVALEDASRAMFIWPSRFHQWGAIPFPKFCFDFNMIFHRGCLFIRHNKFYIPIITCVVSAILFFSESVSKKRLDKRTASLTVLILVGIFYIQQLIVRTDSNHLAVSFPPTAILFGVIFSYKDTFKWKFFKVIKIVLISYVSLLMVLLVYRTTELYIKDVYIKPFIKKSIEPVRFERGTVYIPDDVRNTFVSLVEYVENNTKMGEKIYIGNLKHKVSQMGWFDLIYFITGRLPAVKYYVTIPGLQSSDEIQNEMIFSLEKNKTRVLLLRDYGETNYLGPLDKYIRDEYELDRVIDSYHIYVKK